MKPFLLVSTRPEEEALVSEYQAYLQSTGLSEDRLELAEFDLVGLPPVELGDYQGVFVAGSPYGNITAGTATSRTQRWVAEELREFFRQVLAAEIPCLATGTAMSLLTELLGGKVADEHMELSEVTWVTQTREGMEDPLLAGVAEDFLAYVSHTEAARELPAGAVRLAWSPNCPVQMFRHGQHIYATQFSPELDGEAIQRKTEMYADAGDFRVGDLDMLVGTGRHRTGGQQSALILRNFVKQFS
ncbi:glutamine amidotransferase [Actinomyces sp. F1_1611]